MVKYNILDLFSGVGGLSYGFSKLENFNVILANEIEKDISVAYKMNYPDVKMLNCDISELEHWAPEWTGKPGSMSSVPLSKCPRSGWYQR